MWRAITTLTIFLIISITTKAQSYQYFFGNIHAHSSYSDGNKDSGSNGCKLPGDSYTFAKQSYNLNFLGISEHNYGEAGMKLGDYRKGLYQADTANKNGEFIAMYGMEFGVISNGGHVLIYGVDSLIGWEPNNYDIYSPKYNYDTLWKIIASKPNAFATLAHPETSDYNNLSTSDYSPTADAVICGTAVRSGGAFSQTTDYSDPQPSTTYTGYYRRMLAAGYKLGPTLDHDNHYTTFGRTAQSRTVILAQTLNRDSIIAAYKAMRFYASDDWNAKVDFTIDAYPLGSSITTFVNPTINVSITDPDVGDNVASIRIHYGVPGSKVISTTLTSNTNSTALTYVHNIQPGATFYYYAEITQVDGHKIWTSPIWVTRQLAVLPLNTITLKASAHTQSIELNTLLQKASYASIDLQKSFNGSDFKSLEIKNNPATNQLLFTDNNPAFGHQYYRLKCVGKNGEISYSAVVAVNFKDSRLNIAKVFPNPATTSAIVIIESSINARASCKVYNVEGRLVDEFNQQIYKGKNQIVQNLYKYSSGKYFMVIDAGITKAEVSFIKQ